MPQGTFLDLLEIELIAEDQASLARGLAEESCDILRGPPGMLLWWCASQLLVLDLLEA